MTSCCIKATRNNQSERRDLMPFRFRRTIRIAPGLSINLGKKSASVRVGGRGAGYTVSTNGNRTTSLSIPGTGISWSKTTRASQSQTPARTPYPSAGTGLPFWERSWVIIACILLLPPIGLAMTWAFASWSQGTKYVAMLIAAALTVRLALAAFA